MSTTVVNALSYDSKRDAKVFAELLAKSYTIENDNISIIPNIKTSSVKVNKFSATKSGLVQEDARNCAWDANGTLTFGEKEIVPANLKVNVELCKEDLDQLLSQETYKSVKRGEMPPAIEDVILEQLQNAIGQDNEKLIWTASKTGGDACDGIITQATTDANVVKVSGTTLSSANVLAEIVKVYDAMPQEMLDANDKATSNADAVKIFVSPKTFRFAMQALSNQPSAPTNTNVQLPSFTKEGDAKNLRIFYLGIEIVKAGVGDDTMFAAQIGNLVLATNLLEDANLKGQDGVGAKEEGMYYVKAQYRLAATYVFSTECVLYA